MSMKLIYYWDKLEIVSLGNETPGKTQIISH